MSTQIEQNKNKELNDNSKPSDEVQTATWLIVTAIVVGLLYLIPMIIDNSGDFKALFNNKGNKTERHESTGYQDSYDGLYVWRDGHSSCSITVYGSSWNSKEEFLGNYSYNSGTLRDNKLYMDGYMEVGYISGNKLYYLRFTLEKTR